MSRPENGPMVFEGDWPGVFIRGDSCFCYANALSNVVAPDPITQHVLDNLRRLLLSAVEEGSEVQSLRPFDEAKAADK